MIRTRVPWMLLAALLLFLTVLGVSRVADFGILDGEPFGASDAERNEVKVTLQRTDHLELTYGPTRYPYVWIVGVDSKKVAHPLVAERHTRPNGEVLIMDPLEGRFELLCLFSPVPRTLQQIQKSLDQDVRLPGLRYSWVIGGELSDGASRP